MNQVEKIEELNKEEVTGGLIPEEMKELYNNATIIHMADIISTISDDAAEGGCELIQENQLCNREIKTYADKRGTELFIEYVHLVNYLYSVSANEMFEVAEHKGAISLKLEKIEKILKKFKEKVKTIQKNSLEIDTSEEYEKYFEVVKEINLKWEQAFGVVDYIVAAIKRYANRQEVDQN